MMCGPPIALSMNGIVRNGPMPIMTRMFAAIACSRPSPRSRCAGSVFNVVVTARATELYGATVSHRGTEQGRRTEGFDARRFAAPMAEIDHEYESHHDP